VRVWIGFGMPATNFPFAWARADRNTMNKSNIGTQAPQTPPGAGRAIARLFSWGLVFILPAAAMGAELEVFGSFEDPAEVSAVVASAGVQFRASPASRPGKATLLK